MSDVTERLKDASAVAKSKAGETAENVRSGVMKAVDQASSTTRSGTSDAFDAGMQAVDQVREQVSSVGDALKASIERQPFAAVSLAAAVGFLFGMMFFRRD